MNLAITGASGNIGGMVARHLSSRGLPLILPLRNPAKAPDLPNTEARHFAYGDFKLAKQALNGVDVLFMVSAAESPTRGQEHLTLVQAALEAGVQHIVYLSFAQAALDSTFTLARTHAVTENAIRQTNMRHTFLRDNFYSEMMATIANADGIIAGRDLCKKAFPPTADTQTQVFGCFRLPQYLLIYPNAPLILPGRPIIGHPDRLLGGSGHT